MLGASEAVTALSVLVPPTSCHATAIGYDDVGVLLIGPSGAGKSALALQLMAFGAGLISDDLVWIGRGSDGLVLSRPLQATDPLQIEARGVGLLSAKAHDPAPCRLIIDLSQTEIMRLPEPRAVTIAGYTVPYLHKTDHSAFPAMILQYLRARIAGKI